jgi:hypothetical protein
MATKFNMTRDINGYNGFGLQFTDTAFSATLTASTDTTLTVPSNSGMGGNGISSQPLWLAVFSYDPGTSVWVAINTPASAPAGSTFGATQSELNPAARLVKGKDNLGNAADVLHFFSTGTAVNVSVIFYSLS